MYSQQTLSHCESVVVDEPAHQGALAGHEVRAVCRASTILVGEATATALRAATMMAENCMVAVGIW